MPDISEITRAIGRRKNLSSNLPQYTAVMAQLYNRMADIRLAMNSYMYQEMLEESDCADKNELEGYFDSLSDIILRAVKVPAQSSDEDIKVLDGMREQITASMEIITAYVDRFAVYEYVLNRIEFRFNDTDFDADYYNSGFTNDIMHYILEHKDPSIANSRINEMVAQLPVRMTKQKLFEHVRDAYSLYKGGDMSSLKDFDYMLRTVSGIYTPEGFDVRFSDIHDIYTKLTTTDYSAIDKAGYEELVNLLSIATSELTGLSDMYVGIMEIINDAYIYILTIPHALVDMKEAESCRTILENVLGESEDDDTDINDCFISLEGHQEKVYERITSNDHIIDTVIDSLSEEAEKCGLLDMFDILKKCSRLSSGSNFVSLDDTAKEESADDAAVTSYADKICNELLLVFKNNPVIINRAVMAIVLGSLPVFFDTVDDIQNYINNALMQCSDEAEQRACVTLIRMIMDEA